MHVVLRDSVCLVVVFFFQAEDGIRDVAVTGVQTCALPISMSRSLVALMLIFGLSFGGTVDAAAQSSKHHRKSKKPKSPPCRTGCKPETSEPQVAPVRPKAEPRKKKLPSLPAALNNPPPGA